MYYYFCDMYLCYRHLVDDFGFSEEHKKILMNFPLAKLASLETGILIPFLQDYLKTLENTSAACESQTGKTGGKNSGGKAEKPVTDDSSQQTADKRELSVGDSGDAEMKDNDDAKDDGDDEENVSDKTGKDENKGSAKDSGKECKKRKQGERLVSLNVCQCSL
jgi:hypothetical protein